MAEEESAGTAELLAHNREVLTTARAMRVRGWKEKKKEKKKEEDKTETPRPNIVLFQRREQKHSTPSMSVLALQEYEFERQFNEEEAIRWMQENW